MTYDIPHRHQQALDPSSLDTVATCLHALQAAAKDCLNSGACFESDPAVMLLAQHLGAISAAAYPDQLKLRQLCAQAISEVRAQPTLVLLVRRGGTLDPDAKRLFQDEAKRALRRLAGALGLDHAAYDLRTDGGGLAVPGEVTLHGEDVYVRVSLDGFGPGDLLFRSVRGRRDYNGARNHWAQVEELLAPDRFARRITQAIGLELPVRADRKLAA